MANNAWNALVSDINAKISEASRELSEANSAEELARTAAENANTAAGEAEDAAQDANEAAEQALAEASKWSGATVAATTLEPDEEATVTLSEKDGVKHLAYGIPRGKDGAQGPKGDMGKSGVKFTRSGTTLYITTEV